MGRGGLFTRRSWLTAHTHTHTPNQEPWKAHLLSTGGAPRTYCKILAGSALCPELCLPLGTLAHLHNSCVFAVTRRFLMKESSSRSSRESTEAMGGRWNLFRGDCAPASLGSPVAWLKWEVPVQFRARKTHLVRSQACLLLPSSPLSRTSAH